MEMSSAAPIFLTLMDRSNVFHRFSYVADVCSLTSSSVALPRPIGAVRTLRLRVHKTKSRGWLMCKTEALFAEGPLIETHHN